MMQLMVIEPGIHSSIQDLGRFGVGHMGLSQGGAIDLHAHCWANKLLNNPVNAATLEITYGNLTLKAMADVHIAVTGAETECYLDDKKINLWKTHHIKSGQIIGLKKTICRDHKLFINSWWN